MKELELFCLNSVCDDFENVSEIYKDVHINSVLRPNIKDVNECIKDLVGHNYIQQYKYDLNTYTYVPVKFTNSVEKSWFFITQKGRLYLDEYWDLAKKYSCCDSN